MGLDLCPVLAHELISRALYSRWRMTELSHPRSKEREKGRKKGGDRDMGFNHAEADFFLMAKEFSK